MLKRKAIAVILFASQATLAVAQSTQTMDRGGNPEDSSYLGGWVQSDTAAAGTAATPRARLTLPVMAAGHVFVGPEDSGYLGGVGQDGWTPAGSAVAPRASVAPTIAVGRHAMSIYPDDSGYLGGGA